MEYMSDTWLIAAVSLFVIAFCAILRMIPGPTRFDRIVALNAGITIAAAGAVALSISSGDLRVLDVTILVAILCYAGIFALTHLTGSVDA